MIKFLFAGKQLIGTDVTPSYSRSGGRVLESNGKFYVPRIDAMFPEKDFNTLNEAWNYCETAYYSYN